MCSTDDGCWASPRNNQRLNQTSPTDRLADNNTRSKKSKRLSYPTESIFLVRVFIFTALCIINTVLFTLLICATILVVPACYCVRKIILHCSLRHYRHGKLKKMSASEAMWLAECANTENTAPVSNIFFIFEGKVTLDEIQTFITHKLLLQSTLRNNNLRFLKFRHFPVRVITGYGWNEINNLNINSYVLESKETLPSMPTGLKGIFEELDAKNPETLWRVLLFPGFEDSENTGVLFQVHESIADVFPSTKVVLESLDYKTIYLKRQCFLLGRLATYLSACYSGPFVIIKRLFMKRQRHFCLTRSEETSDSFDVSWSRAVDFKSVKRIKDVTRTKVDIVLLSCVAGAIRSFLQKHKVQDPDDILVCIRTDIRPQHTKLRLDNKFSMAFVKLPVGTEVTGFLIANLAVADLGVGLLCIPFTVVYYELKFYWPFGAVMCKVLPALMPCFVMGSVGTMLAISIDRHQSIVHPFGMRITRSQGKLIMLLIWLTALLPAFPMLGVMSTFNNPSVGISCGEFWPKTTGFPYSKIYLLCSFALTYAIPLPIMILIYVKIGLKLRQAIKEGADRPGFTQAQATKRIIKMLSAVVICYALCFLPFHTLYFMMDFGGYQSRYMYILQSYFQIVMFGNSATNPVLYAFLGDQFKKGFKRAIGKGSRRGFSPHTQRTLSTRVSTL